MELAVIGENAMRALATHDRLYEWVHAAMIEVSEGRALLPLRRSFDIAPLESKLGMMPGHLSGAKAAGIKLVSLVPPHRRKGSSHLGLFVLYDEEGLVPLAILNGAVLTALRTSAASAVATDVLARKDASHLALIGAGEQAIAHLSAIRRIRQITRLSVWNRTPERAQEFVDSETEVDARVASSVADAVAEADIVCTLTAAGEPILKGNDLPAGCHVNVVGSSHAGACEVDANTLSRARVFLDYWGSAKEQAGEIIRAVQEGTYRWDAVAGEIGEVLNGTLKGRQSGEEITVYKSLGVAAQDIATARGVFDLARAEGMGSVARLD